MRRCYIAASTSQKYDVHRWALVLKNYGIDVNMRWLAHEWKHEGGMTNPQNLPDGQIFAWEDWQDAARAELMICNLEKEGKHNGRLVELGIGLSCAQEVWVVGPHRMIFSYLKGFYASPDGDVERSGPIVRKFLTMDDAIDFAERSSRGARTSP